MPNICRDDLINKYTFIPFSAVLVCLVLIYRRRSPMQLVEASPTPKTKMRRKAASGVSSSALVSSTCSPGAISLAPCASTCSMNEAVAAKSLRPESISKLFSWFHSEQWYHRQASASPPTRARFVMEGAPTPGPLCRHQHQHSVDIKMRQRWRHHTNTGRQSLCRTHLYFIM
jgi:hypothetical protein